MIGALSSILGSVLPAAGTASGGAASADAITIDTGDVTPTVGAGAMNLLGGGNSILWLGLAVLVVLLLWRGR